MTNYNERLDEILINFFNEAEVDAHSDNYHDGVVITKAGTKAKQQLLSLKKKWEAKARLDEAEFIQYNLDSEDVMIDWLQDRINQLNGDKR